MNEVAKAAREYLEAGFVPIPLLPLSKAPTVEGWPGLRLTLPDIPARFPEDANIGLLTGEAGNCRQDVDSELIEAVRLARFLLPATGFIHGRPSLPSSHWWYNVESGRVEFLSLKDTDGTKLVELRWGAGQQTMVPPSIHPCGEQLTWYETGEPATVNGSELSRAVRELAAATLIMRHYPTEGSRHALALAVSGLLLRRGWPVEKVTRFVEAIATVGADNEISDRLRAVETTAERFNSGAEVVGGGRLRELLGNDVVGLFCEWLGFAFHSAVETIEASHIADDAVPLWPADTLEGDYLSDLTYQLTVGTPIPPQFVREEINLVLAALADGRLGYPRHPDLPMRRFLTVISEFPQACKGESWKRVAGKNGCLSPVLSDLKILNGTGIGSGQYLAKELEENPRSIGFWDEATHLFQVAGQQNSTVFSAIKSLFEGTSHFSGSFTNKKHGTDDAHLSLLLHSTRKIFVDGFALRAGMGDGLLSRFTISYCPGMPAVAEWEPRIFSEESKLVATIASLIPSTHTAPEIADDARERVHEFAHSINNPDHPHFAHTRRLLELMKVDVLHRCIYSGSGKITLPMVSRSIAWAEHQLALRLAFWPSDAHDKVSAMTQVLLNRLRKGAASANDLRRAASVDRDGSHETFTRCLSALQRSRAIRVIGKNRKHHEIYELEPADSREEK